MRRFFLALVFTVMACKPLLAQDECELILNRAQEEFNAGHLYGIAAMLSECLDKHQNSEWRQRAYLLLAETYLLLEDPIGAEQSYLNVLRANPEYLPDQSRDPIDLVYLSRRFTATPIFSFYVNAGTNVSPVTVLHDVRIGGEPGTQEKYALKAGWQFGAGFDYHYDDHITASAGLQFLNTGFKHTTTQLFGTDKDKVEFVDRQTWLNVPVTLKYSDNAGLIRPYGYVGFSMQTLLGDRANIRIYNRDQQEGEEDITSNDKQSPNLTFKDKRAQLNQSVFIGGGVKYKYKLEYFFVDVRLAMGLKNVANPDRRYDEVTYRWAYVDDDFRLNNIAVSVGYIHPFYKPRKLKRARTRSLLRQIKRDDHAEN